MTCRRTGTRRRWPSEIELGLAGPLGARGHLPHAEPHRPAERGLREGRRPPQVLRDGHVPVPLGRRAARRPPAGLPGHRRHQPVPPHGRRQRAAPDGLRRLRPARRAVRRPDRAAPAGHHRGQHRGDPRAAAPAGRRPRRPPQLRHDRPGLLQVDPVDLPADLRVLVRRARRARPGASRSWSPSWTPARGSPRRAPTRWAGPWAELDEVGRRLVVDAHRLAYLHQAPVNWCPGPGHRALQRGGHRRRPLRAGQLPGVPAPADPVDDADHRLRRPAARRPGPAGLVGLAEADAAQLDRPLDRRADRLLAVGERRPSRSSPPGPTPCSAPPTWCWRPSTRWSTR